MVFHERRMIALSKSMVIWPQPMLHASYSYRGHTSTSASQGRFRLGTYYRRVTFSHDYMTTAKWIQSVASSNLMASLDTKLLHEPTLEIAGDATGMAFSNDFIFRHLKWKRDGFRPVFSGPWRYNSSLAVPAPGKKIKVPTFPSWEVLARQTRQSSWEDLGWRLQLTDLRLQSMDEAFSLSCHWHPGLLICTTGG